MACKKKIALITNESSLVGGLPTLVTFLHRVLAESGRYEPEVISLATSVSDGESLRLIAPRTWLGNPRIASRSWNNLRATHVGVWGAELEFQRYRPRTRLTGLLSKYDLLQFVVGSPPWACVARFVDRPIMVWTATLSRLDRGSGMRRASIGRRSWSSAMLPITEHYERKALKAATTVFALSDYTRDSILPIVGKAKILVAPCGVDTSVFTPARNPSGEYILCVGRFSDPRKNVRLLLSSYAHLLSRCQNAPDLYLVGESPTEENRKLIKRLGISDRVRLFGSQDQKSLADLYRHALFFVLSSNEEGLGIVILEAMASGLAVISTDCGGPATMVKVEQTGFLTPVGDSMGMCEAMVRLLNDPLLRMRMGAEGRRIAEERFSTQAAGKVFLDKYDDVLGTRSEC